jgi:hypothetical protein
VIKLNNQMFQKHRRRSLKQALEEAGDRELRELRDRVAGRQERVAQLELELFDTRADLARFEHEMEERLGKLKLIIAKLEHRVEVARRNAARRAQWGDRADSPDVPEDVVEQFRRRWKQSDPLKAPPPKKPLDEASKEEFKTIFRSLAKRFHPDLAINPEEKQWRVENMAEVNRAYAELDMSALKVLAEKPDWSPVTPVITREQEITELHIEIGRLDGVIANLERTVRELINSDTVKLMLDVSIARKDGRDLLGHMEDELLSRIASLEKELATIG